MPIQMVVPDGNKLLELRLRMGWTQEEAAEKIGYSDRLVRKAEKGEAVRPKTLKEIVRAYQNHLPGESVVDWNEFRVSDEHRAPNSSEANRTDEMKSEDRLGDSPESAMARNLARIPTYFSIIYEQRKPEWIRSVIHSEVKFTSEGVTRFGIAAVELRTKTLLDAFDPIEIAFEQLDGDGEKAFFCFVAKMRHVGEFFGIMPKKQWVNVRNCSFVRFQDEMIVEVIDQTDMESLLSQLRGDQPTIL